ncbi:MAG: hypothetical protein HQM10_10620 [Candidatus Riflebacteria bacterium]|nr:hypothetical protein [Candidatus Riflebacteria bacterium]
MNTIVQRKLFNNNAFSLIELMLSAACAMMILPAIWMVLQSGTKVSLRGSVKVNTTLVSRTILRQVCSDLRNSCVEYGSTPIKLDVPTAIIGDRTEPPYSFYVFPYHGKTDDSLVSSLKVPHNAGGSLPSDQSGRADRRLSQITYELENVPSGKGILKKLVRKEKYHPSFPLAQNFPNGVRTDVLSDRVQSFLIERETFNTVPGSKIERVILFFRVSIQLVDVPSGVSLPDKVIDPAKVPNGIVISDFFDIVSPVFFNERFNCDNFNPGWHTGAVSSPEKS